MRRVLYTDDPQTKARIKADGLKQARAAAWVMAALFACAACVILLSFLKG